jgi:hypothetical protein
MGVSLSSGTNSLPAGMTESGEGSLASRDLRWAGAGLMGTATEMDSVDLCLVVPLVELFEEVDGRRGEFTLGFMSCRGSDPAPSNVSGSCASCSASGSLGLANDPVVEVGVGGPECDSSSVPLRRRPPRGFDRCLFPRAFFCLSFKLSSSESGAVGTSVTEPRAFVTCGWGTMGLSKCLSYNWTWPERMHSQSHAACTAGMPFSVANLSFSGLGFRVLQIMTDVFKDSISS